MTDKHVLSALIVEKTSEAAEAFTSAYGAEFLFEPCDFTNTLHRAVQSLIETEFLVCFIGDHFTPDELASFFRDVHKIDRKNACVYVQVRNTIAPDFDRSSVVPIGFKTAISPAATHKDKEVLTEAVKEFLFETEVAKRVIDVDKATKLLLKEIDMVAKERKRGANKTFSGIAAEFITLQTEFAGEVLDKYFTQLTDKTEKAAPQKIFTIAVPASILSKNLPKLEHDKYTGVSHRVWDKLLNKHGVGATQKPKRNNPFAEEDAKKAAAQKDEPGNDG